MLEPRDQLQHALGGDLSIQRELVGGGMARVFLARDERLGRNVVVKLLRPELADGTSIERFRREIEVAASLRHPNIVPLLDAGGTDGLLYYTMPFIAGESLRALLERGALPEAEAIRLAAEVADALSHAHAAGIVHRDIKPENILIDSGHAVVTDFGIARALSRSVATITTTGVVVGTMAYMSPEQATGATDVDARTDTYALGCVVLEMLTGVSPRGGPAALHAATGVRAPVRDVLARATALDAADRFPTTEAFRQALVGAGAARLSHRARRAAIAAVVVIATAITIAATWPRSTVCTADTIVVSGRVLDAARKPLSGADAWVPPLVDPVLTRQDGSFRILVPNATPLPDLSVRVRPPGNGAVTEVGATVRGCDADAGTIVLVKR